MKAARAVAAPAAWLMSLAAFALPVSNPDLFWHLSAARRMAQTWRVPRADWLSHTMAGAAWVDFEWLCQLAFYAAMKAAGAWGLVALKGSLLAASGGVLWATLGLYGVGTPGRSLTLLVWALALSPANDVRPENFSLLLFQLLWLGLERRRLSAGGTRETQPAGHARALGQGGASHFREPPWGSLLNGRRGAAAALGSFVMWANLHAGFIYGLALMAIYAAAEAWRSRRWVLARLWAACAAATLVNPYGFRLHAVAFDHARSLDSLQRHILEWQEPTLASVWFAPFWVLLLAAFLGALARYLSDRRVPAEHLAALGWLSLAAAGHARLGMYFTAAAAPLAACHLSGLSWPPWRAARGGLLAAAFAAAAAFFGWKIAPELALGRAYLPRYTPDRLAAFLHGERTALGRLTMLNPWAWGGYLGWKLHPDYKVFVDGRYLFHHLLGPMQSSLSSPAAYKEFLDARGIGLVLVERSPQLVSMSVELSNGRVFPILRPITLHYLPRREWALVYWNPGGLVFVRRSAVSGAWLKEREFRLLRPDDFTAAGLLVVEGLAPWEDLDREARRFIALNPGLPDEPGLTSWVSELKGRAGTGLKAAPRAPGRRAAAGGAPERGPARRDP